MAESVDSKEVTVVLDLSISVRNISWYAYLRCIDMIYYHPKRRYYLRELYNVAKDVLTRGNPAWNGLNLHRIDTIEDLKRATGDYHFDLVIDAWRAIKLLSTLLWMEKGNTFRPIIFKENSDLQEIATDCSFEQLIEKANYPLISPPLEQIGEILKRLKDFEFQYNICQWISEHGLFHINNLMSMLKNQLHDNLATEVLKLGANANSDHFRFNVWKNAVHLLASNSISLEIIRNYDYTGDFKPIPKITPPSAVIITHIKDNRKMELKSKCSIRREHGYHSRRYEKYRDVFFLADMLGEMAIEYIRRFLTVMAELPDGEYCECSLSLALGDVDHFTIYLEFFSVSSIANQT